MKLIFTAETFSSDNKWTEYEVYTHGARYRVDIAEMGLGGACFDQWREWWTKDQVVHMCTMPDRDIGIVDVGDELACDAL